MNLVKQHLISRHVDLSLHKPIVDESENVATFFLYTPTGIISGFQQYRPNASKTRHNDPREGRYFTYRRYPAVSLFGVESLSLNKNIVFLTEGIFDAVRFTKLGYPALAVLSNNMGKELNNYLSFLNRKVVAVCDNDESGKKLAKFGDIAIFTEEKDIGEETEEYVSTLIEKFV